MSPRPRVIDGALPPPPPRAHGPRHSFLSRLSGPDREAIVVAGEPRLFREGAPLFLAGQPATAVHVIEAGCVRLSAEFQRGSTVTVGVCAPGDLAGDIALFNGAHYAASAFALTETRTLAVPHDAFADWLAARPAAAFAMVESLSERLLRSNELLIDVLALTLRRRLAKWLLTLAGSLPAPSATPQLAVTQGGLAAILGASRESVHKELKLLEREGYVTLGRGRVTLHQPGALANVVEGVA